MDSTSSVKIMFYKKVDTSTCFDEPNVCLCSKGSIMKTFLEFQQWFDRLSRLTEGIGIKLAPTHPFILKSYIDLI